MRLLFLAALACLISFSAWAKAQPASVTFALNWIAEPEFGGIYSAEQSGAFTTNGLAVTIKPGGAGAPTWQRVAQGQAQFAVSSADEVVIARAAGADVKAIFAVYQTCPQGIMVHASRGLKSIDQVFRSGTLALEVGLPYGKYLKKQYGFDGVKTIPYTGGIANFLADPNFAQQCFVFSEPLSAKAQGADARTFLIAESGYNPYTGVVITSEKYATQHPAQVMAMVRSLKTGWSDYLSDPRTANAVMGKLNTHMSAETFAAAAKAQESLIADEETKKHGLGSMTLDRWTTLVQQLTELGVIDKPVLPGQCFIVMPNEPRHDEK